jgi:hypothetical protein
VHRGTLQPQHDGRAFFHGIANVRFSESAALETARFFGHKEIIELLAAE